MGFFRFLHVLGAILLVGNVIVTGLWAHWAIARREPALDVFAAKAILRADLWLTLTGGTLLVTAGLVLVRAGGWPWTTPWLAHGAGLLVASTAVWLAVLLPDQWRMARHAAAGEADALRRVYRRWAVLGWLDTALLIAALAAMVVR